MEQRDHHPDQRYPDVSKSVQAQQPQQQPEMDQQKQPDPGHLLQSGSFQTQQPETDTITQERSDIGDIEGSAATGDSGEAAFLGTQGSTDTSSELIDDEGSDFARDRQSASQ